MSIKINVGGMNYIGLSCAERTQIDKRRKDRLTQVRQQSKEIAQQVRFKVQCEKENQLKKFQLIKQRELNEWKKRKQCDIQEEYGACLTNFGAAHMAACEASCEEDEGLLQKREENDLLAAQRGRSAMLQEQRKRDRAAEERLLKRKRKQQKNAAVQANIVTRKEVIQNPIRIPVPSVNNDCNEEDEEEEAVRVEKFSSKPNLHKSSTSSYNPKNFTSNSVDSSNNNESEDEVSSSELDSEEEFNQITNLLKQKCYGSYNNSPPKRMEEPTLLSDDSSIEIDQLPPQKTKRVTSTSASNVEPANKSILKKSQPKPARQKSVQPSQSRPPPEQDQRVKYVDFGNKYTSSYLPSDDLVTKNAKTTKSNAQTEARKHQPTVVNDDILRELAQIRHQEALEKEKTRRDYERLRMELDELSKYEKEARDKAGKPLNGFSSTHLNKKEQNRVKRMNEAVENALKRNIITCPVVGEESKSKRTNEVNVAASSAISEPSTTAAEGLKKSSNDGISYLVKVERLKDLLERINHQKKLLLREIEKNDDIPGPDLEKVMQCLEKLEKEKAALDVQKEKKQEMEELVEREQKLQEREKMLENKIREMYKAQKASAATRKTESVSSEPSDDSVVVPPVEITIKVLPKSPRRRVKVRKSIRCLDTLNRAPGKSYPKTPRKAKISTVTEEVNQQIAVENQRELEKIQQETQTSPALSDAPKPILKKPQENRQVQTSLRSDISRHSEDSSHSTAYQSLPDQIHVAPPQTQKDLRKPHHKLNPVLMHYITRLLGMNKDIGNQLSVNTSPVETPGSSTINTSGNCSSIIQLPNFDQRRLEKLQHFINDNYSFLNEINETLERSQMHEESEDSIKKVDGIWRDVLRKKKPAQHIADDKSKKSEPVKHKPATSAVSKESLRKSQQQQSVPPKRVPLIQRPCQSSNQASKQQNPNKLVRQCQQERPRTATATQPQREPRQKIPPKPQITNKDMLNVTKHLESHMMNNFAEYTANCQKRISELAQMMERVRQEKLKLIENSLSSGEFGHFTEYKEIVVPGKPQDVPTSASDLKDSPSQREDPPSEEINNILQKQTRPFGVSKDSGISLLSRPVTSSDFRDTPDNRVTSEERENTFQPILKDIPKPPKVKVTEAESTASQTVTDVTLMIKEQEEKALRKQKPPLSLNRFSPNLEKPHQPHELSTIAEVETPSASKVNLFDRMEECGVGQIESFPCFEDYAKKLQLNLNQSESLSTSTCFPNLSDLKKALDEMKIKSFLAPAEYGIQELSNENVSQASSNASSLMDIYEELKRRNIIDKPFQVIEDKNLPASPESPKRNSPPSRIVIKTPDKVQIEIHREKTRTPTKRKTETEASSPSLHDDSLSGIQEIEKETQGNLGLDLNKMGLNWAASMLKRGNDSKKIESSSSSTSVDRQSIEIDILTSKNCDRSSSSSTNGRPLNLREFLVRELTKRSLNDKSLSDESSLSSQFMRSLLNASSSGSKSGNSSDRKLITSTPVPLKDNSTVARSENDNHFIGESMSTLRGSEGDASGQDKSKNNDQTESN